MNRKIIPLIVIFVIVISISVFIVFQKPVFSQPPRGRCGDGICGPVEKANPNLCPKDCQSQTTVQPRKKVPAPSTTQTLPKRIGYPDSPFGIHGENQYSFDNNLLDVGINVVRYSGGLPSWDWIERTQGVYNWSKLDSLVSISYKNGIKMMFTVRSFNKWDQGISVSGLRSKKTPKDIDALVKFPKDIDAYTKFLKTMVERYDGDGIDDALGSPVVEYFQIENEVDGYFWSDTPKNYAKLLTLSYKTVKQANPNAKVLIAGVSIPRGFYDFYISVLEALSEKSFDIFDLHWYGEADEYKNIFGYDFKNFISDLKDKLSSYGYKDIPIWISETATYGGTNVVGQRGNPLPEQNEAVQSANLIKRYIYYIANGIDVVMWYKMMEVHHTGIGRANDYFENTGLINNPQNSDSLSHQKLAYYIYKKMVEVLEGSNWDNIQIVQESNGIYIYKFIIGRHETRSFK